MANKILGVLIGITTCVILLGALLVPTITGLQEENTVTYTNEGVPYSDDPGDFTLYNTSNTEWVFNDETVTLSSRGYIFISDSVVFYKSNNSGTYTQLYSSTGSVLDGGDISDVMFKIDYEESSGTITYTKYTDLTGGTVDVTDTYTCTSLVVLDPDGDYVSADSDDSPYVNSIDQVYSGGRFNSDTISVTTCYFSKGEDVTLGLQTATATASATLTDVLNAEVYQLSGYAVAITGTGGTETVTPSIFVPAAVTGHTADQNMQNVMYGAVIAIAVVGVAVASIMIVSRKD